MQGQGQGLMGQGPLGQSYMGGSPYPVEMGRAQLGVSRLGGWVTTNTFAASDQAAFYDIVAIAVGPSNPIPPFQVVLGWGQIGAQALGGIARQFGAGASLLGSGTLGGMWPSQPRSLIGEAQDAALFYDLSRIPAQPGNAVDTALFTDFAQLFIGTEDVLLFEDSASSILVLAPRPGYAMVTVLQLTDPTYFGTALETVCQFLGALPLAPMSQWQQIDPLTVTLKFVSGPGSEETTWTFGSSPQVVRVGPGLYSAVLETSSGYPGRWRVQWTGSEPVASVGTTGFLVAPAPA